jgi:hypothetical protein
MSQPIETLNRLREDTIVRHYDAAMAELKSYVSQDPLQTIFYLYSGCATRDIADEVCRRFNNGAIRAVVLKRFLSRTLYMMVEVPLPEKNISPK